jgi:hypothetical protein
MSDVGRKPVLYKGRARLTGRELDELAEAYLEDAMGDPAAALLLALADGHVVSRLVSRVFARSASLEVGVQRAA